MVESPTRIRFVHVFSSIPPDLKFYLKDLPGSGKRIDILCRGLAACFDWAPEVIERDAIEYYAVFSDRLTLRFQYHPKCRGKGEVWWAKAIRDLLEKKESEIGNAIKWDIRKVLESTIQEGFDIFILDEDGADFQEIVMQKNESQNSFMLGDHRGFELETQKLLDNMNLPRVSLGETSYLGSHCIAAIISNYERLSTS